MIPQRVLGATTVKFRVAACRRRLRVIRAIHKAQIPIEIEGQKELLSIGREEAYDFGENELPSKPPESEKAEDT